MRSTSQRGIFANMSRKGLSYRMLALRLWLVPFSALVLMAAGCSTSPAPNTSTPAANPQGPSKTYFAPVMGDVYPATYSIDHSANTFVRKVYGFNNSPANGATVTDSGVIAMLPNGVTDLGTTYNENSSGVGATYDPPLTGSWAVELPGEAALVGMKDYTNFTPIVPTNVCPSIATAAKIQFVTIPNRLSSNASMIVPNNWNPQLETAFGIVQVSTNGTSVQFSNVKQYTVPADGRGPGTPANPGETGATSVCASTFYGQTIGVPTTVDVIDPGTTETVPPSATIGIGPSGFLVEDAGSSQIQGEPYENILGAGYGAIGLLQPTGALDTASIAGAHYLGFLYGSGGPQTATQNGAGFSAIGSFGYSNLQASCPVLPAPKTSSILYGGEFEANDPSKHASGNCDLAVDLGKQNVSSNGLYTSATVYVTASFPFNVTGKAYSFPAVVVAGQINGKNALFLIGVDTVGLPSQAWGIYLLQSS